MNFISRHFVKLNIGCVKPISDHVAFFILETLNMTEICPTVYRYSPATVQNPQA